MTVAEGEDGSDGAGGVVGDVVAPGPSRFVDEVFGSELA